jgi:lysyl-tRNA synthetase class 1
MYWVDEIVKDILKKNPKDSYLITDWKTPSGHIHIGALRGVMIHELIKIGLENKEKKAEFQWGYDDFDPMDGLPVYIDKSYEKHMGKPLCDVSAPDGKSKNYAEQYLDEFNIVLEKLDIKPKIVKTSQLYRDGKFNDAIKIVLDNANEIRKIYKEVSRSEKDENWYPFQVVCPKCGKIGTTKVSAWDGKEVEFECVKDLVDWAKGCGYKGKISPFDGNGKLPWKVEWPSKWDITKTDIEGEGKDHAAASGSREVANKIYRDVFKKEPPYDIPYEHFLISGAKMSSSKGKGATSSEIVNLLPKNIVRFLFCRTKYKRTIDFAPSGDTIPLLYDEFDRALAAIQNDKESDLARALFYTEIDENPPAGGELPKYTLRFSKIAYMLQMPRVDIMKYAEDEKKDKLSEPEKEEIESRINVAKNWLENYAPENYKFSVQEKIPEVANNLSVSQKDFLGKILEVVKSEKLSGEDFHKKIHEIKTEINIPPRDAFSAIYMTFIGKDSGPQAGWLLASLDKDFVIKRLEEVLK